MKVLLVQPLSYLFAAGGAHKANRLLAEGLVELGHQCTVVSAMELDLQSENFDLDGTRAAMLDELEHFDVDILVRDNPNCIVYQYNGVQVYAVDFDVKAFSRVLQAVLEGFQADWTIVTEDRSGLWLQMALEYCPDRVVYLAHSQATLPFGPEAFEVDPVKTAILKQVTRIIAVSAYLKDYIAQWGGMDADVLYFPSYGTGPYPFLANFDAGAVAMINPSIIKGSPIFVQLTKNMPDVEFAVVPSWSTSLRERILLGNLPNVRFIERSSDMNNVLRHVRVLLVPSLWGECFGQVCVDALLRGIPVLASNLGGLPEATLGAGVLLPVRPIAGYRHIHNTRQIPVANVPQQDVRPWQTALTRVLTDRAYYDQLAHAGYTAAAKFVDALSIDHFERYFLDIEASTPPATPRLDWRRTQLALIAKLSPERRALLARRIKQV